MNRCRADPAGPSGSDLARWAAKAAEFGGGETRGVKKLSRSAAQAAATEKWERGMGCSGLSTGAGHHRRGPRKQRTKDLPMRSSGWERRKKG